MAANNAWRYKHTTQNTIVLLTAPPSPLPLPRQSGSKSQGTRKQDMKSYTQAFSIYILRSIKPHSKVTVNTNQNEIGNKFST